MAPMKLYGSTMSWNMTRSALALEEAGADYEIVPINFATAEHKSPEHLARNVRILSPAPLSPLFFSAWQIQRRCSVRVLMLLRPLSSMGYLERFFVLRLASRGLVGVLGFEARVWVGELGIQDLGDLSDSQVGRP